MLRLPLPLVLVPLAWCLLSTPAAASGPLWSVVGDRAGDGLGSAVAGVGDLNGDGFSDVAIGEPGYDGAAGVDCGRARVFSSLTGQLLRSWEGEAAGDLFGSALGQIGDVNVDGRADVVVGAPNHTGPAGPRCGKVYLFSGATGLVMRTWDGEAGGALGIGFGTSLSQADVDHNAQAELIVGAPRFDGLAGTWSGKVYVFNAATGALVYAIEGPQAYCYFGFSVRGVADLNFDFRQDLLVGAPYFSGSAPPYNGKAFAFSGANAALIRSWEGESSTSLFGYDIADAGDANGDGARDVAIAAAEENNPGVTNVGKVFIFSGLNGALIRELLADGPDDELFGCSLAYLGDVDNDHVGDLLVGARGEWGATGWGYGAATIFSGRTGEILFSWMGEAEKDGLGVSVCAAGDTDGDGFTDVVVGAFGHDGPAGFECGKAYVFSTNPSKLVFRPFGVGMAGSGGYEPVLSGTDAPYGKIPRAVRIDDALGGAHGLLWLGLGSGDLDLFGGHLYVELSQPWWALPLAMDGSTGAPGDGGAALPTHDLEMLDGLILYLQVTLIDPGAAHGISLTNALEVTVTS